MYKQIPSFTKEDFLESEKPYRFILDNAENEFRKLQMVSVMSDKALKVGVKNFKKLFFAYELVVEKTNIVSKN
ncbi:MAG: hypothetical protein IJE10_04915 [Clostridia bacterium]|nr:hypothetical protein [Clostridia bacterium]